LDEGCAGGFVGVIFLFWTALRTKLKFAAHAPMSAFKAAIQQIFFLKKVTYQPLPDILGLVRITDTCLSCFISIHQ
jgi:hypothetical protein